MFTQLSELEKDFFLPASLFLVYMQALRFMTDHLMNDIYYGARYEGHNLIRARNQIALLKQMVLQKNDLQKIVNAEIKSNYVPVSK